MSFRSWIQTEEKQEVIESAMVITRKFRDEILACPGWRISPAVRSAEKKVDKVFNDLLEGVGSIEDYRKACEQWKLAGLVDQTEKTTS